MARGLVICSQTRTIAKLSFLLPEPKFWFKPHCHHHLCYGPQNIPSTRVFCHCVGSQTLNLVDMAKYHEAFSRRMAMSGIKHHNRIALGVSGGPDSMALCVLAANWKTEGLYGIDYCGKFIDGLLAIIVDHGLRPESKDEASLVGNWVSEMGIRCEIARCDWLNGKPKQGHLQEAARDMRYKMFQDVCRQNQISVLLVAHHADDQILTNTFVLHTAELFILRSSRDSGVLGLAGMAFTSQVFSSHTIFYNKDWKNHSVLLVLPLLDFSKEDMYKVPLSLNYKLLFLPLEEHTSMLICTDLIKLTVTIMDLGYAVINLKALDPTKIEDICLSKFITLVLQFVSQGQRPIRGSTSKLLLQYIRTIPCKTSLTAAGCYICLAPGSKALVCCSVDCPLPSNAELFHTFYSEEEKLCFSNELEQIKANGKSYSNNLVPDASQVQFLDTRSESILDEDRRLDIISESTFRNIILLQREEVNHFKSKTDEVAFGEVVSGCELKQGTQHVTAFLSEPLLPGQTCYFMNRFIISWKLSKEICSNVFPGESHSLSYLGRESQYGLCCCVNWNDMVAKITCSDYSRLSAKVALKSLKSIPVAGRKSIPVLVNDHGQLLSIPSIGFKHCPFMMASAVFKPRVPLGGGHRYFFSHVNFLDARDSWRNAIFPVKRLGGMLGSSCLML